MNSHNSSRKTSMPVFKSTRLLDQLREQIRYLHYSLRTGEAYVYWFKKFIRFHQLRHPRDNPWMDELARPVPKKRIPVVLTRSEVQAMCARHFLRRAGWPRRAAGIIRACFGCHASQHLGSRQPHGAPQTPSARLEAARRGRPAR